MTSKRIQTKGVLAKLLEKSITIILKKECTKIGKLKLDIIASTIQIISGFIQKVNLKAEDVNYKDLLFDEIELEANELKIIFQLNKKKLNLKNNSSITFKISLSENSLKKTLTSNSWNWISEIISKEVLNKSRLEDLKLINDQLFIRSFNKINTINEYEQINIKAEKGKIYLKNSKNNKSIKIPIEDKIYIKKIFIENNLITINAHSSIYF